MISASLNRCKGMEDPVGDFLKQLAAKLELVLLIEIQKIAPALGPATEYLHTPVPAPII